MDGSDYSTLDDMLNKYRNNVVQQEIADYGDAIQCYCDMEKSGVDRWMSEPDVRKEGCLFIYNTPFLVDCDAWQKYKTGCDLAGVELSDGMYMAYVYVYNKDKDSRLELSRYCSEMRKSVDVAFNYIREYKDISPRDRAALEAYFEVLQSNMN